MADFEIDVTDLFPEVDCLICYMGYPTEEVGLQSCRHQYCANCLAMTFKTQKDGPKCPEPNCGARATADELRAIIQASPEHTELLEMLENKQD